MATKRSKALQRILDRLKPDMAAAAMDVVGTHYVASYYEQIASDFVFIAEQAVRDAWRAAKRRANAKH